MSFKNRKRDDHGHVIGNDEVDGQECKHVNGGAVEQDFNQEEWNKADANKLDQMKKEIINKYGAAEGGKIISRLNEAKNKSLMSDVFDDDYDEEFDAADEEYNREMKKAQEENAKKAIEVEEFDKDEFDEEPKEDLMDPKNPKYEGFKRSDITNAKVVDEGKKIHNYDYDKDETLSIIEYIPYGALQDGDNRKLYGVVRDYDGSDTPKIGAIVSPDLKGAQEDLKSQIELAEQGSERYLKRGKWDEEFFNIMNDKEYDFDDDTKKKYSEKYGWDFNKPWNEQEHIKGNQKQKYKKINGIIYPIGPDGKIDKDNKFPDLKSFKDVYGENVEEDK